MSAPDQPITTSPEHRARAAAHERAVEAIVDRLRRTPDPIGDYDTARLAIRALLGVPDALRALAAPATAISAPDPGPQVIVAMENAITDLTGQAQIGAAYAKAFIKRLGESGVQVVAAANETPGSLADEVQR